MSNDQKIMDKFVEQTQEILVLKDLNRKLKIENDRCKEIAERDGKDYSDVVQKLKIAVDALNTILMASQKSEESHALNVYYTAHDAISKIEVKNETVG